MKRFKASSVGLMLTINACLLLPASGHAKTLIDELYTGQDLLTLDGVVFPSVSPTLVGTSVQFPSSNGHSANYHNYMFIPILDAGLVDPQLPVEITLDLTFTRVATDNDINFALNDYSGFYPGVEYVDNDSSLRIFEWNQGPKTHLPGSQNYPSIGQSATIHSNYTLSLDATTLFASRGNKSGSVDFPNALDANQGLRMGFQKGHNEVHQIDSLSVLVEGTPLGIARHYAGPQAGQWHNANHWTDTFAGTSTGIPVPTLENPVFINRNAVRITDANAEAESLLVNGGTLEVATGRDLSVVENLELGNSVVHGRKAEGQGWVRQYGKVSVGHSLILGGVNSVYDMHGGTLDVANQINLHENSNAVFRQTGGTINVGTLNDQGRSTNGSVYVRAGTTYDMSAGRLNTHLLDVAGQFLFRGGELWVNTLRINNVVVQPVKGGPNEISAGFDGNGRNGFVGKERIYLYDQYSDWVLPESTPDLVIGVNPTDYGEIGERNSSFVQYAGSITLPGDLIIGDGQDALGSYGFYGQELTVGGNLIVGRNGGEGHFTQEVDPVLGAQTVSLTVTGDTFIGVGAGSKGIVSITNGQFSTNNLTIGTDGGMGTLHLGQDATLHMDGVVYVGQGVKVTGSYELIEGPDGHQIVRNDGELAPGNSAGEVILAGDYEQLENGQLSIELGNPDQAGLTYDHVLIHGDATLDGTLQISLLEDALWNEGAQFDVLHAESITLDGLEVVYDPRLRLTWQVLVDAEGSMDVLRLTAEIPEPGTVALLALGAPLLLRRRAA